MNSMMQQAHQMQEQMGREMKNMTVEAAAGGGAVMDQSTRALIARSGVSVWLKADAEVLQRRTRRRNDRPLADRIAAEHLEIATRDPAVLAQRIRNAGAIFLGAMTPEVIGDYVGGSNHVLPTARTARFSSPLGVYDFQKRTSLINCSQAGAKELGKTASVLARGESLTAHARSAEYRI